MLKTETDLLSGNIVKSLLVFAVPIFLSNIFQQLYNTADMVIVGHFLGESSLAAIGACAVIFEMLIGFAIGVGGGFGIVVSRSYGAGDKNLLKRAVAGAIVIGGLLTLFITVVANLCMMPLLQLINIPAAIIDAAYSYILLKDLSLSLRPPASFIFCRQCIKYPMSLFCLLCIPLLYFLRRRPGRPGGGESIWGLPLGAAAVAVQYFVGPLVTPGAFGFSRWFSGFVDIVGLPALLPLIVCGALVVLRAFPRNADYAGFALLWLIPLAAIRSMSNSPPSPLPLIVVPLLWSAQAIGIPFFIGCALKKRRWYIIIPSILGIAALPIAAATSWWAFFSQQTFVGGLLLLASFVPTVASLCNEELGVRNEELGMRN